MHAAVQFSIDVVIFTVGIVLFKKINCLLQISFVTSIVVSLNLYWAEVQNNMDFILIT